MHQNPDNNPNSTPTHSAPFVYPTAEHMVSRLQSTPLSLPCLSRPSLSYPRTLSVHPPSRHECSPRGYGDELPTIIDTFAPKPNANDVSPTSSASSDLDHPYLSQSITEFLNTRSRVIRLFNLPHSSTSPSAIFGEQNPKGFPTPVTMWALREDYNAPAHEKETVWAVFRFHEEACAALTLSGSLAMPALESDLEPFHKLRRFQVSNYTPFIEEWHSANPQDPSFLRSNCFSTSVSQHTPRMTGPTSNPYSREQVAATPAAKSDLDSTVTLPRRDYTISSNPPNPRTSFRFGDWICNSPSCAAHNFGRNASCIGCGHPRGPTSPHLRRPHSPPRSLASPRFVSSPTASPTSPLPSAPFSFPHPTSYPTSQLQSISKPPGHSHPLLTPSGRAFANGGKVQNISSDPLAPCVMYWPDNEPLPEQGQIRPSAISGIPQPPILNTGNRGPIEHQPGDWICLKCNYLNWRRRKVCQTCFPYAEGNGDSISAAVQAERIALLTSVLNQSQIAPSSPSSSTAPSNTLRSQSLTPPQCQRPFVDISPPKPHGPVLRSQSHLDLNAQYTNARPIYQTSGYRQPSPNSFPTSAGSGTPIHMHTPAPLLPSFLQDIIQSPTLSPSSTSSADLSFEDYDETVPSSLRVPRGCVSKDSTLILPPGNIWRLDGEETKTLSGLALPNNQDLMSGTRKDSRDFMPTINAS